MNKKDEFKEFVRNNPRLLKYVNNNEMTWQKFYEMYDMYGKDNEVWKKYTTDSRNDSNKNNSIGATEAGTTIGLAEIFNMFKNVDLDSIQNGVSSIQRVIGVLQDFGKVDSTPSKEEYKPRPIYKHFED